MFLPLPSASRVSRRFPINAQWLLPHRWSQKSWSSSALFWGDHAAIRPSETRSACAFAPMIPYVPARYGYAQIQPPQPIFSISYPEPIAAYLYVPVHCRSVSPIFGPAKQGRRHIVIEELWLPRLELSCEPQSAISDKAPLPLVVPSALGSAANFGIESGVWLWAAHQASCRAQLASCEGSLTKAGTWEPIWISGILPCDVREASSGRPVEGYLGRIGRTFEGDFDASHERVGYRLCSSTWARCAHKLHRIVGYTAFLPDGTGLEFCSRRSKGPFVSSLSRRTISMVLRMSASLKSVPIVEAIAWNRVLSSR